MIKILLLNLFFVSFQILNLNSSDLLSAIENKPKVLVVGGAGFIGSYVNKLLNQKGFETIVLDNLSHGSEDSIIAGKFIKGGLEDMELLDQIFSTYKINVVMHFAAYKDVGESCTQPDKYYLNNVCNSLTLFRSMVKNNVKYLIFSSSAAIFSSVEERAITEDFPCKPLSPYGHSKAMVEQILKDFDKAYPLKYCSLRYFNAVGGDPEGVIKNREKGATNLIPCALRSLKNGSSITVFGTDYPTRDGTCIRDYVHIHDLAIAHILAMEYLLAGNVSNEFNLGCGSGFTVFEVFKAIEKVTGRKLDIIKGERRPGDAPVVIANPEKANKELGWYPSFSLEMMVKDAWQSMP